MIFIKFLLSIFIKNIAKRGVFTCRVTWRAAADVARGTASGCDAALRPLGRARVARARRKRRRVARPRGKEAMQPRGRPCGAPRVGLVIEGTGTKLIGESTPLFNRTVSCHFFRVGLCPTHLTFCRRRGRVAGVTNFIKTAEIAWTQVHAIINQARA